MRYITIQGYDYKMYDTIVEGLKQTFAQKLLRLYHDINPLTEKADFDNVELSVWMSNNRFDKRILDLIYDIIFQPVGSSPKMSELTDLVLFTEEESEVLEDAANFFKTVYDWLSKKKGKLTDNLQASEATPQIVATNQNES